MASCSPARTRKPFLWLPWFSSVALFPASCLSDVPARGLEWVSSARLGGHAAKRGPPTPLLLGRRPEKEPQRGRAGGRAHSPSEKPQTCPHAALAPDPDVLRCWGPGGGGRAGCMLLAPLLGSANTPGRPPRCRSNTPTGVSRSGYFLLARPRERSRRNYRLPLELTRVEVFRGNR